MKLLQLNASANWGSTGKIAESIGLAAMTQGWESYIAYGRWINPSKSHLIRVGTKADVYAHYARHRLLDGEGLGSRSATRNLIAQVEALAPDIIHLHNIHDHWLNYKLLFDYLRRWGGPVVWTFHDCWAFTGGCCHFENSGCFRWTDGCHKCPFHRKFQLNRSARNFRLKNLSLKGLENRLTVVCVSKWLSDYVKQSFFGNCRVEVIHNGIDLNVFKPSVSISKRNRILGVSNIWPPYKGLGDFIKLREILPQEIEMVLVGLNSKQISALPKGIIGVGRTKSVNELVEFYQSAKVFVNPSHMESFPTVNLEALACGTPVVTYRTGGSPEAITPETGLVVAQGDIEGLAEAVRSLCNGSTPITRDACRARAEAEFNCNVQFDKYISLYNRLLIGGGRQLCRFVIAERRAA